MTKITGIGIDQGISSCGYGVVELCNGEIKVLEYGTITSKSTEPTGVRFLKIFEHIEGLIDEYGIVVMGCEKLFFNPIMKKGRNKSASMMDTNMVTGILWLLSAMKNVKMKSYVPGTVKKYVAGKGTAKKEEVEKAVKEYMNSAVITKEKNTEHDADAVGIGITTVKELAWELENPPKTKVTKKKRKDKKKEGSIEKELSLKEIKKKNTRKKGEKLYEK